MKDPALRSVSSGARGLWIDILCLLCDCVPRGYLQSASGKPYSPEQIARMTGNLSVEEVSGWIAELEDAGVPSRTDAGVLYSRRIVRDEHKRNLCAEAGKLGGNPTLKGLPKGGGKGPPKGGGKGGVKGYPTPSSSSSSSNTSPPSPPPGEACGGWGWVARLAAEFNTPAAAVLQLVEHVNDEEGVKAPLQLARWRLEKGQVPHFVDIKVLCTLVRAGAISRIADVEISKGTAAVPWYAASAELVGIELAGPGGINKIAKSKLVFDAIIVRGCEAGTISLAAAAGGGQ